MAAKIGRSGQPMQKLGGRGGTVLASSLIFGLASTHEWSELSEMMLSAAKMTLIDTGSNP